MFTTAKKVARPQAEKPTKEGKAKTVVFVEGLVELAALDACAKALEGLIALKKDALKEAATAQLIDQGIKRKAKPDSLSMGAGSYATGTASIMKRSTRSPMTSEELDILADIVGKAVERDDDGNILAIPGFVETIEVQPAMMAVNPEYAKDDLLLKRIDKALAGVKGIPDDFILSIPAETKAVVTDGATNAVFALDPNDVPQVFDLVASVSIRPVFKNLDAAWEIVRPMLDEAEIATPKGEPAKRQQAYLAGLNSRRAKVA